tara:strand:- start:125 stop:760 length:636 start_codon:yes stop_codon:yes gene_type:complete
MVLPASVDTLRGTLGKRGGVAKANRFSIYMPLPLISINPGSILTNLASGNGFNPMSLLNDPRDMSLLCESCSLPGRTIATTEHITRLKAIKKQYGYINDDVTFTFLLTGDYYIKQVFDDWTAKLFDFEKGTVSYKDDCVSDVTIQQLGPSNIPIYTCKLQKAFPVSVSAVELANTSENTISRVTVTMAYDEWSDGASLAGTLLGIVANKLF